MNENNRIMLIGEVATVFTYSHEVLGEGFYMADMLVRRLSKAVDRVPLTVSERLIDVDRDFTGETIKVTGEVRSFNRHEGQRSRLILSVFVHEVEYMPDGWAADGIKTNLIQLDGYVCREPNYRKTPSGREITDLLLAVNRAYGKSDYVPCICWGRNARYASAFVAGDRLLATGRFQSRCYVKKLSGPEGGSRTAYEVSIFKIERRFVI